MLLSDGLVYGVRLECGPIFSTFDAVYEREMRRDEICRGRDGNEIETKKQIIQKNDDTKDKANQHRIRKRARNTGESDATRSLFAVGSSLYPSSDF